MSTIDIGAPSSNGGSRAWAHSWTHLRVDRRSAGYCRVTFDHPPINAITATTVAELSELVDLIEDDHDLNVVVFGSANPDYYLAHREPERANGMHAWADLLVRLPRAPVLSIASVRGRARGAGSEFVAACDVRFASRENALLGPAGQLPAPVGRGRALEIILGGGDLDGPRAAQYGYVNRAIADDELDDEVHRIASRVARLDHDAIGRTKAQVERVTLRSLPLAAS